MQLIGQSLFGEAVGDILGFSVDMTPDGKTVAIGAPGVSWVNDRPGYVTVFYLESDDFGSSWKQLGPKISQVMQAAMSLGFLFLCSMTAKL